MLQIVEDANSMEIQSRMRNGKRILFLVMSLFPLLAPYELIIQPDWKDYLNPFFLFAATISVGAMAVSLMLIWAGIAGLNSRMKFDRVSGFLTYTTSAPIMPIRTVRFPIGEIARMRVDTHDWTEGSPSFSFLVELADGRTLKSGSSWSEEEIDRIVRKVSAFIGMPTHS